MSVKHCPRCQRSNPEAAAFCYFDGALLQGSGNGAGPVGQLNRDFVFPSGRRCKTFDEFALGCQEEWVAARDLLSKGVFLQFFGMAGRADLARAAQESMAHTDNDIGLTSFLGALPGSRTYQPKLDIHPRRLDLGKLLIGEGRRAQITVSNTGQGQLQGTLRIAEGGDWLSFAGQTTACPISTPREQKAVIEVNSQKLQALKSYTGKLTVVTNGGIVEVPIGLAVVAKPFLKPPFAEVKTPRDMAVRMRDQPKAAVPLLESGDVQRWFTSNNWNYPVPGEAAKGVAGVQQFFEAMGLSKPPVLQLSQSSFHFRSERPEPVRGQVVLSTAARKWVYAKVTGNQPWLRVLTPQVAGPQRATISFEIDAAAVPRSPQSEAALNIVGNAGQKLTVRVVVEQGQGAPVEETRIIVAPSRSRPVRRTQRSFAPAIILLALTFLCARLCLVPVVDLALNSSAIQRAAAKMGRPVEKEHPLNEIGGWLRLPWTKLLAGTGEAPGDLFDDDASGVALGEFRYQFVKYFTRGMVLWLWWLGPLLGAILIRRRGGSWADVPWGILAGAVAGVIGAASLACFLLLNEAVPRMLWDGILSGHGGGALLILWILLVLAWWMLVGGLLGLACSLVPRLRSAVLEPLQNLIALYSPLRRYSGGEGRG